MTDWSPLKPPSIADFEVIAAAAFARLPDQFRSQCADLVIKIEDLCEDEAVLRELGIESAFDLSGLYHGRDLAHRSVADVTHGPDYVFLYRLPILAEWAESDETLGDLIAHVLIHEIGHHFGLSDDDIYGIEARSDEPQADPKSGPNPPPPWPPQRRS